MKTAHFFEQRVREYQTEGQKESIGLAFEVDF